MKKQKIFFWSLKIYKKYNIFLNFKNIERFFLHFEKIWRILNSKHKRILVFAILLYILLNAPKYHAHDITLLFCFVLFTKYCRREKRQWWRGINTHNTHTYTHKPKCASCPVSGCFPLSWEGIYLIFSVYLCLLSTILSWFWELF